MVGLRILQAMGHYLDLAQPLQNQLPLASLDLARRPQRSQIIMLRIYFELPPKQIQLVLVFLGLQPSLNQQLELFWEPFSHNQI